VIIGQGLHGGERGAVRFGRLPASSSTLLRRGDEEAELGAFVVVDTARSTTVAAGTGLRIATVEHLFAALAAYGARRGVAITLEGPEVPLADGGARAFCDALEELDVPATAPRLRVARAGELRVGASVYAFAPAAAVSVEAHVDFGDPRLSPVARWEGDRADFRVRIAPARTFGFEREVEELLARGLAKHVAPESVVVITDAQILAAGPSFSPDEPARHKLLDLIGDLFVHGGPPLGSVVAHRPGHAATHEAVRRALDEGLLANDL
jgi:UDP-3-O-[3-hydroxymyristoyl] N-acetylglucosamine deacetylase